VLIIRKLSEMSMVVNKLERDSTFAMFAQFDYCFDPDNVFSKTCFTFHNTRPPK